VDPRRGQPAGPRIPRGARGGGDRTGQVSRTRLDGGRIEAGQSTARLEVPTDAFPLFERAVPIWLYSGDRMPKGIVHEAELSNPVFCINQPALTAHLHGGTTANRVRELGWLSIAEDRELEDLIRALQGTMVFDKTTLIDAWPPDREMGEEPADSQLLVAYSSIDYTALRSNPRLNQSEVAIRGSAAKGLPIGPADIQLALRSITDAFNGIVGRAERGRVRSSSRPNGRASLSNRRGPAIRSTMCHAARSSPRRRRRSWRQIRALRRSQLADGARMHGSAPTGATSSGGSSRGCRARRGVNWWVLP
jgi:hypothetical protein